MSKVDLHLHSNASDGQLSPSELISKAVEKELTIISLTDHDTVDGIAEALKAAKNYPQLVFIPGLEMSTDTANSEIHMLGYFIDHTNQKLLTVLEQMRNDRQIRAERMTTKLNKMGINIDWQRIQEMAANSSVGRPHIAQAMLEKGYINTFKEAFIKYIGREGPAYVERTKMSPSEAISIILEADGLPVLAHPLYTNDPETVIQQLKGVGLIGLEVYYNSYTSEQVEILINLANKYQLMSTGGSDYHGIDESETPLGGAEVPQSSAEQLINLAKQRGHKINLLE